MFKHNSLCSSVQHKKCGLGSFISTQVKKTCQQRNHFILNCSNCLHAEFPINKINDSITSKTLSAVCQHFVNKLIIGCSSIKWIERSTIYVLPRIQVCMYVCMCVFPTDKINDSNQNVVNRLLFNNTGPGLLKAGKDNPGLVRNLNSDVKA